MDRRRVAKTLTWRLTATTTTLLVVYFLTGRLRLAGTAAVVETVVKTIIYYLHESFWANIEIISFD